MSFLFEPAPFDDDEDQAHKRLLDEFGEWWVHIPTIKRPRETPSQDDDKPSYRIRAEFEWDAMNMKLGLEETGVDIRQPTICLRKCDIRFPIQTGHWFLRCKTGEKFEVMDYLPDSLSGVEIHLNQLGLPP